MSLQSSTGRAITGLGVLSQGSRGLASCSDTAGDVVGKISSSEDFEEKEVNFKLPKTSLVPPSHVSTSLGSLGLDFQ